MTPWGSLIVDQGIHFSVPQFPPTSFGGDDGDTVAPVIHRVVVRDA